MPQLILVDIYYISIRQQTNCKIINFDNIAGEEKRCTDYRPQRYVLIPLICVQRYLMSWIRHFSVIPDLASCPFSIEWI